MVSTGSPFIKELYKLARNVGKLTAGQVRIEFDEENDASSFVLYITPNDGYYKHATFKFKVIIPETYPERPPLVLCMSKIYHPNIDLVEDAYDAPGSVCVSLLDADWQAGVGLDGCVMAVLFLFYHPNLEDALSPVFDNEEMIEGEFERNVRASLRGEEVEGFFFDKLIDEDSGENGPHVTCSEGDDSNSDDPDNDSPLCEIIIVDGQDLTDNGASDTGHVDSLKTADDTAKKKIDDRETADVDCTGLCISANSGTCQHTEEHGGPELVNGSSDEHTVDKSSSHKNILHGITTENVIVCETQSGNSAAEVELGEESTVTEHVTTTGSHCDYVCDGSDRKKQGCPSPVSDNEDSDVPNEGVDICSEERTSHDHLESPCDELAKLNAAFLPLITTDRYVQDHVYAWDKTLNVFERLYRWLKHYPKKREPDVFVTGSSDAVTCVR